MVGFDSIRVIFFDYCYVSFCIKLIRFVMILMNIKLLQIYIFDVIIVKVVKKIYLLYGFQMNLYRVLVKFDILIKNLLLYINYLQNYGSLYIYVM